MTDLTEKDTQEGGRRFAGPVLNILADERVLFIEPDGDGFTLREGCDEWFSVRLTAGQMLSLAAEISRVANSRGEGNT